MQEENNDILRSGISKDQIVAEQEESSPKNLSKKKEQSTVELNLLSTKKHKDLIGNAIKLPFCSIDRKYKSVKKRQKNYAKIIKIARRLALHPFTHKNLEVS